MGSPGIADIKSKLMIHFLTLNNFQPMFPYSVLTTETLDQSVNNPKGTVKCV